MWSDIGLIFVASFFTACLCLFIEYTIQEGEIFGFWQKVLKKFEGSPLENPLGGCIVCMSVWVCLVIGFFGLFFLSMGWWTLLPYIVVTNFLIRLFTLWL